MEFATAPAAPYTHNPLPLSPSDPTIRLFSLHPGLPLRGTLRHHTISSAPSYSAISYTWGSQSDTETILIDNAPFDIRVNLYSFLYQLSQTQQSSSTLLWCDAICIDQTSIGERNAQVRLMGQIYSTASSVLIWLGPSAHDSAFAFNFITTNLHAANSAFTPIHTVEDSSHFARFIRASAALCRRGYWRRAWIIQEILLARSLVIHCGDHALPFRDFLSFTLYNWYSFPLSKADSQATASDQAAIRTSAFASLGRQRDDSSAKGLRELLLTHGSAECTDVKDRVYALVGLAVDGRQLEVDYGKSTVELVADVLELCDADEGLRRRLYWSPLDKTRRCTFSQLVRDMLGAGGQSSISFR